MQKLVCCFFNIIKCIYLSEESDKKHTHDCMHFSRFKVQYTSESIIILAQLLDKHPPHVGSLGALWVTYVNDTRLGYLKRLTNDNQTVLICFYK